jgi:hypothetical protein
MTSLNATLVPWLIAEYGIDYQSWDHVDIATEMIASIVTKLQLGGYTSRTFPAVVEGHRVEQTAFTKFVLRQAGNFIFLFPFHLTQQLTSIGQARHALSIATLFAPGWSSCCASPVKWKIAERLLQLSTLALNHCVTSFWGANIIPSSTKCA